MTNREKYLKDEVNIQELWKNFDDYYYKNKSKESDVEKAFRNFFEEEAKPTLTEDERVILRNIHSNENYKTYKRIGRTNYGSLYLSYDLNKATAEEIGELESDFDYFEMYNNLFQFIKDEEEYSIEELLK